MTPIKSNAGVDLGFTEDEKEELLGIARTVIERRASGEQSASFTASTDKLREHRGAFVTLYKKGFLRGCIGSVEPKGELYRVIEDIAESAAFRDPRFRQLAEEELPHVDLEISVLTPLEEIHDPDEVKVGVHGILVRKGPRSGLLLPQVATERDWDNVTFLRQTCRKAGLDDNAWKEEDAQVYVFSADVF